MLKLFEVGGSLIGLILIGIAFIFAFPVILVFTKPNEENDEKMNWKGFS